MTKRPLAIDAVLPPGIREAAAEARRLEAAGFDGLWTAETQSDPLMDLALPAVETTRPVLGTNITIAFARSPFSMAVAAWQLQRASGGRLMLGLGTQVKGHIERRFGMKWESPGPKFREYVQALKAIWAAFQREAPLDFHGRFYTHTLISPFFDPGPIDVPPPKVLVAAVNEYNAETAGMVADGLVVHPLHSERYLDETMLPAVERGIAAAGRSRDEITVLCPVFVITGSGEQRAAAESFVRVQIAFYGSTRTYAPIFAKHGWDEVPGQLHALMARGDIEGMGKQITDEMLDVLAIVAPQDEVAGRIRARYAGRVDRLYLYTLGLSPFGADEGAMRAFMESLRG